MNLHLPYARPVPSAEAFALITEWDRDEIVAELIGTDDPVAIRRFLLDQLEG